MTDPERGNLTRITFNATPRAVEALDELGAMTGLSRTDALNRAAQVYRLIEELTREQGGLRILRADGSTERIHII